MNEWMEKAFALIEGQQPKAQDAVWCVGEQLKDILRGSPSLAELVARDLENKAMSLSACERKIKARADEKHKGERGGCACVTAREAEEIIREFYGLMAGASDGEETA